MFYQWPVYQPLTAITSLQCFGISSTSLFSTASPMSHQILCNRCCSVALMVRADPLSVAVSGYCLRSSSLRSQVCPEIFNRRQIGRIRRPVHDCKSMFSCKCFEEFEGSFSGVWTSIVLLEFEMCLSICCQCVQEQVEFSLQQLHVDILIN